MKFRFRKRDEALRTTVPESSAYARVNPEHKLRIVRALQANAFDPARGSRTR